MATHAVGFGMEALCVLLFRMSKLMCVRTAVMVLHLLFAAFPSAASQPGDGDSTRTILGTVLDDVTVVGEDGLAFLLAPLSFGKTDFLRLGAVVAGTGGLMIFDEDLQTLPRRNQTPTLQSLSNAFNYGGHLPSAEIATAAIYLAGLVSGDEEIRVTGRMLAQSLIYSGSIYLILRTLAGRHRPFSHDGAYTFDTGETDNTYQSFPSGHTTVAFSLASVLSARIDHPVASVLLYGAAAMTGLSRIYQDNHWTSDVFFGAVLGTVSGLFVQKREKHRADGSMDERWSLTPTGNGLTLTVRL